MLGDHNSLVCLHSFRINLAGEFADDSGENSTLVPIFCTFDPSQVFLDVFILRTLVQEWSQLSELAPSDFFRVKS